MIYRYAWTVNPKPHTVRLSGQLRTTYLEAQLSAIGKLGAICQKMRTEVIDDYFHHAQAYLRWDDNGTGCKSPFNVRYPEIIMGSTLLLENLRHVCIYWTNSGSYDTLSPSFTEALYWLRCLKQLRTLEVVVTSTIEVSGWHLRHSLRRSKLLRNLQGLEKATIKYNFDEVPESGRPRVMAELNCCLPFLEFKKNIERLVTLPEVIHSLPIS